LGWGDDVTDADGSISDRLGERIRDLRTRLGMSQTDLADSAREHGAGGSFSTGVVGFLETGRRREGRRTRMFTLDELLPLAAALEVSPLELLGVEAAQLFAGEQALRVECPTCVATAGGMEKVTRKDLARLGELSPLETTLVETAFRLAKAIDEADDARVLPALTKELRATVQELGAGRRRAEKPSDDDDFGDLDDPD
jgi:transcriptional regulator with XRE-family HTH domain